MSSGAPSTRVPLLVSLAVAGLGCVLLATYVRQFQREAAGGSPISLLAMRRDVPAGEALNEQMLIAHTVPENYVESRQVLASELPRVLGVRAAIDLEANQTLAWTDLASTPRDRETLSARVPPGMRAMSVEQGGRAALGQLLRPGDRVDVLLTRSEPGPDGRVVTVPLLQNILLLAVGNSIRATYLEAAPTRADFVTLLLTVDQSSLLAHAKRGGELTLALRNENDLEVNEGLPETDDSDVFVHEKRAQRQRRVLIERLD